MFNLLHEGIMERQPAIEISENSVGFAFILTFGNPVFKNLELLIQRRAGVFALSERLIPAPGFQMNDQNAEMACPVRDCDVQACS